MKVSSICTSSQYSMGKYLNNSGERINPKNDVNFTGHFDTDVIVKNGVSLVLKNETAFFRDFHTKKYVRDYVARKFKDKEHIKMVVGGCSTGEEAYTYSMMLDRFKSKLSILGFDLSPKAIERAKSRESIMRGVKNPPINYFPHVIADNDRCLCFDTGSFEVPIERKLKNIFNRFYDVTDKKLPGIPSEKRNFLQRLGYWYLNFRYDIFVPTYDTKVVKLKDGKCTNCQFVEGDIWDLKNIVGEEKADVITFANSIRYLIMDDVPGNKFGQPKPNAREIVHDIGKIVKENLNPNGIFVVGEDEITQTNGYSYNFREILKELGFTAINRTYIHPRNVFRLRPGT